MLFRSVFMLGCGQRPHFQEATVYSQNNVECMLLGGGEFVLAGLLWERGWWRPMWAAEWRGWGRGRCSSSSSSIVLASSHSSKKTPSKKSGSSSSSSRHCAKADGGWVRYMAVARKIKYLSLNETVHQNSLTW